MRIVSLLSSATEILFAIGAGNDVVAISHECDYPIRATSLPRASRSLVDSSQPSDAIDAQVKHLMESGEALYEIDRDLIRSLQPDLIVTQAQCDACAVRYQDVVDFVTQEPSLSRTKIVARNPLSLSDVLQDVVSIGKAAAVEAAARSYVESLEQRVVRVRAACGTAANRPRVVCIEWVQPLMTAGNWTPELISLAGGASCLATPGNHSGYVTWPDILAARPEVLIVAPCGFNLDRSMHEALPLRELPNYSSLPAIINHRAYILDGNAYLNRSGPRLIDTLELLAHLIHPNLFPPVTGPLSEHLAWSRLTSVML